MREKAEERMTFQCDHAHFLARYHQYARLPRGNCTEFREIMCEVPSATTRYRVIPRDVAVSTRVAQHVITLFHAMPQ